MSSSERRGRRRRRGGGGGGALFPVEQSAIIMIACHTKVIWRWLEDGMKLI
jgi:hypothetical protein